MTTTMSTIPSLKKDSTVKKNDEDNDICIDFSEWTTKIAKQMSKIGMHQHHFDNEETQSVEPPAKKPDWDSLLRVTNSEYLVAKASEHIKNYYKNKHLVLNTQQNCALLQNSFLILNLFNCCKMFLISWLHIYEDAVIVIDAFSHKINLSLNYKQQTVALLLIYEQNCRKFPSQWKVNPFLHQILQSLVIEMTIIDYREIVDSIRDVN
jgi:hypothetical protein